MNVSFKLKTKLALKESNSPVRKKIPSPRADFLVNCNSMTILPFLGLLLLLCSLF